MTQQTTTNHSFQAHKRLSVQVSLTGLSFLVYTQERQLLSYEKIDLERPATPEELLDTLQAALADREALQAPFGQVTVLYATNVYTIVPTALFDETKASDYLKFNSKLLGNDFMAHESIENLEMVTVYVPYMNVNNYLFDRFGSFEYYHSATVLLEYLLPKNKNREKHLAFVHVERDFFNMVLLHHGTLQLCNSYSYQTPEDFLYYILFTFGQVGANPETIETFLLGDITQEDDRYQIAYKYIRYLSFLEDDELPQHPGSQPQHQNLIQKIAL